MVRGEVLDIAVDIRFGSPNFGKWMSVVLSGENHLQLYIPRGFAHGFVVRSETADFLYKCGDYYDGSDDRGVLWNDPEIGIDWQTPSPVLSAKDQRLSSVVADCARPVAEVSAVSLRVLITGANGQVGWHLQRILAPLGEVLAIDIGEVDLTDLNAVTRTIREFAPDLVANAAAYTNVDKAESEPELARAINAAAPARIAEECAHSGALVIHYSTDYVYDGSKSGPYEESDGAGPLSIYGQTKLEGDQAIIGSGCAHIILRTTWVYDIRGKNFPAYRAPLGSGKGRAAHGWRPIRRAHLGARPGRIDSHHPCEID